MKYQKGPQVWTYSLDKRLNLQKIDTKSGTWNARGQYKVIFSWTVAKEISKHKWKYSMLNGTKIDQEFLGVG
jgi:hypothetical protein